MKTLHSEATGAERWENPYLEDLALPASMLEVLVGAGYKRLDDLRPLSNGTLLMLPHVGGEGYKKLAAALGRKAFNFTVAYDKTPD